MTKEIHHNGIKCIQGLMSPYPYAVIILLFCYQTESCKTSISICIYNAYKKNEVKS